MYLRKALILFVVMLMVGCATYRGNESLKGKTEGHVSNLIRTGRTTKEELRAQFGEPGVNSSGSWTYSLSISPDPKNSYVPFSYYISPRPGRKTLYVQFSNDVVVNYEFNRIYR